MPDQVGSHFYQFKPYHYGPFDKTVYDDAERGEEKGLINIKPAPGQRWDHYSISAAGKG